MTSKSKFKSEKVQVVLAVEAAFLFIALLLLVRGARAGAAAADQARLDSAQAAKDCFVTLASRIAGTVPTEISGELSDGTIISQTSKGFIVKQKDGVTRIGGIIIANKTYSVPEDYGDGLTDETTAAFDEMASAAADDGIALNIVSGYRSYGLQTQLFNRYVGEDGVTEAERYSARPGHSEHQLGEAMDLNLVDDSFADTAAGKWCYSNSYRFGFILRYPPGKEESTGYMQEPWHFRYVGKDLAEVLYNGGDWITVEEYFGIDSVYEDER